MVVVRSAADVDPMRRVKSASGVEVRCVEARRSPVPGRVCPIWAALAQVGPRGADLGGAACTPSTRGMLACCTVMMGMLYVRATHPSTVRLPFPSAVEVL